MILERFKYCCYIAVNTESKKMTKIINHIGASIFVKEKRKMYDILDRENSIINYLEGKVREKNLFETGTKFYFDPKCASYVGIASKNGLEDVVLRFGYELNPWIPSFFGIRKTNVSKKEFYSGSKELINTVLQLSEGIENLSAIKFDYNQIELNFGTILPGKELQILLPDLLNLQGQLYHPVDDKLKRLLYRRCKEPHGHNGTSKIDLSASSGDNVFTFCNLNGKKVTREKLLSNLIN